MSTKRTAICAAIGALLIFGAVSTASAAPVVTYPTGTVLATGTNVKGANSGELTMTSSFGTVSCSKAALTGTLDSNSTAGGSKITVNTASFTGTGTNGECTSWTGGLTVTTSVTKGLPWCIEATTAFDEAKLRGGKCTEASRELTFALDFTSLNTCLYVRTTAANATIHTDDGTQASVTLSGQDWPAESGNPFGCPSSVKLNVTFIIALQSNGDPVYFSS